MVLLVARNGILDGTCAEMKYAYPINVVDVGQIFCNPRNEVAFKSCYYLLLDISNVCLYEKRTCCRTPLGVRYVCL